MTATAIESRTRVVIAEDSVLLREGITPNAEPNAWEGAG